MTLAARLDILPLPQRELWPALAAVPDHFVLYGGTALALRLAHRASVDFDFFTSETFDAERLLRLPFASDAEVLQRQPDTLTLSVARSAPVKVSFFGGVDFGRVGDPQRTADGILQVASTLDLFATKLKVLLQRVQLRDYQDLAAILRMGLALRDGLGAAATLFGKSFPPTEAAKALVYFQGDAANVPAEDQDVLSKAVADWDCTLASITKRSSVRPRRPQSGISAQTTLAQNDHGCPVV